jgi:hypothetical protein
MITNVCTKALLYLPIVAAMLLPGGSCKESKMNQTPASTQQKISGLWGGQGISMEVTDSGATLDFDCASGAITEAIVPDSAGKFSAKGRFARQRPGPTREGEDEGQPAVYSGVVNGENLTLTITLAKNSEKVGDFRLAHGKMGRIRRCG